MAIDGVTITFKPQPALCGGCQHRFQPTSEMALGFDTERLVPMVVVDCPKCHGKLGMTMRGHVEAVHVSDELIRALGGHEHVTGGYLDLEALYASWGELR